MRLSCCMPQQALSYDVLSAFAEKARRLNNILFCIAKIAGVCSGHRHIFCFTSQSRILSQNTLSLNQNAPFKD